MSASVKVPVSMSADEFLSWEPGDGRHWQLVDGEPQAMAPANRIHGTLQGTLARVIGSHLLSKGGACVIVVEPGIIPRIYASHNVRIPDLAVTCSDPVDQERILSDPILVVEILSVSNKAETWANVWAYTSIPSVHEILVLHTVTIAADLLRRHADGTWPDEPERIEEGDLAFDSIGLRTPLADLYVGTSLHRP